MSDTSEQGDFRYKVTWKDNEDGSGIEVALEFGTQLPDNVSDETKLYALSRIMNSLALRLASSSINTDDEDYLDEDED